MDPLDYLSSNGVEGFVNDTNSGIQLMIMNGVSAPSMIPYVIKTCINKLGMKNCILRAFFTYVVAPFVKFLAKLSPTRKVLGASGGINVCLTRPTSTGTVSIRSSDPAEPPDIDPNYLSTDEDRRGMLEGIELAQKIFASKGVARIVTHLTLDPSKAKSPWDFVRNYCGSYWHPTGTCQIGKCLDTSLCVRGIKGLRVADASSLPLHPRVPTQAACMAVGLRCAELVVSEKLPVAKAGS